MRSHLSVDELSSWATGVLFRKSFSMCIYYSVLPVFSSSCFSFSHFLLSPLLSGVLFCRKETFPGYCELISDTEVKFQSGVPFKTVDFSLLEFFF